MSDFDNAHSPLEADMDGHLYDARVRSAMVRFTGGDETDRLEAAAAVRAACHAVERLRSRGAGGRGLSSGALDLLIRLQGATEEGVSIGDLAESIGVTPRNVTGLVDTLEGDRLVRRVPNSDDRRSVLVQTLPAGQEWLESFRRPTQAAMAATFDDFTLADLSLLRHLCLRLVENQDRIDRRLRQAVGRAALRPVAQADRAGDLIP